MASMFASTLHALAGLVSALLHLGRWPVVLVLVSLLWLVGSRTFRFLDRRPLFVAVVLWLITRRRR
jgi:hypothetical protein